MASNEVRTGIPVLVRYADRTQSQLHLAATKSQVNASCLTTKRERMNRELFKAVGEENNLPEVRRLLSVGADVNVKNDYGETPLIEASCNGHVQVVTELVDHGADIEAKDNAGWTPLHWACYNDRLTVLNELLSRGANIEAKDIQVHASTPMHIAAFWGHLAAVNELINSNERNGATTILGKRKSRGGADTEAKDSGGDTPLHCVSGRSRKQQ
jgi:ankyrin repeat protein